jgi:hypothetical protein
MTRTWSNRKDGLGFYYTTDGAQPMLNVRPLLGRVLRR